MNYIIQEVSEFQLHTNNMNMEVVRMTKAFFMVGFSLLYSISPHTGMTKL
jgi:hypothetical protein